MKHFILILLLCSTINSIGKSPGQVESTITPIAKQFMEQYSIPGMAIAVYASDTPYLIHLGYVDKDKKNSVTQDTLFEIGSVSKIFTCLLLAQEVLKGHMHLADQISVYVPSLASNKQLKTITLEKLATHTSSLPCNEPNTVITEQDFIKYMAQWKPTRTDWWQYSNPGIELLRIALEKQSKKTINTLLLENILRPLGMAPVGVKVPDSYQQHCAHCYDVHHKPTMHWNHQFLIGSAAMQASSADMLKFLQATLGLSSTPATIKRAMELTQTPYYDIGHFKQGLGWSISPVEALAQQVHHTDAAPAKSIKKSAQVFNSNSLFEKVGTTNGFHTYIAAIPSQKLGIVIMINHRLPPLGFTKMTNFGRNMLRSIH